MEPKSETLNPDDVRSRRWDLALAPARRGEIDAARAACTRLKETGLLTEADEDLLLGRCLAEAGGDLDEAVARLRRARERDPANVLAPHVLALALLRGGREAEAAAIYRKARLPHDETLLAQTALTLESLCRPWPGRLPEHWPEWPLELNADRDEATSEGDAPSPPDSAMSWKERRRHRVLVMRLERHFHKAEHVHLIEEVNRALESGLSTSEVHLAAGLASEEAGDADRARAHLAKVLELEPGYLLARTFLAKVYWRNGWNDLAEDLWRSLPVEGPDDYGRHYHLALAHETAGRRGDALFAMGEALTHFFIDTREVFIERIYRRWLERQPQEQNAGDGEGSKAEL